MDIKQLVLTLKQLNLVAPIFRFLSEPEPEKIDITEYLDAKRRQGELILSRSLF